MKTFAAPATTFLVRIVKNELTTWKIKDKNTNLVLNVIQFCSEDGHDSFRINDHFNTIIQIHDFIKLFQAFISDVVHAICKPITPFFS